MRKEEETRTFPQRLFSFLFFSFLCWVGLVVGLVLTFLFSQAPEVETWLRGLQLNNTDTVVHKFVTVNSVSNLQSLRGLTDPEIEEELLKGLQLADRGTLRDAIRTLKTLAKTPFETVPGLLISPLLFCYCLLLVCCLLFVGLLFVVCCLSFVGLLLVCCWFVVGLLFVGLLLVCWFVVVRIL